MKWKKEIAGLGFNGLAEFLETQGGEFVNFQTKLEGWKKSAIGGFWSKFKFC